MNKVIWPDHQLQYQLPSDHVRILVSRTHFDPSNEGQRGDIKYINTSEVGDSLLHQISRHINLHSLRPAAPRTLRQKRKEDEKVEMH